MGREVLNIGTTPGDDSGDELHEGGEKINKMTAELYNAFGWGGTVSSATTISVPTDGNVFLISTGSGSQDVETINPPPDEKMFITMIGLGAGTAVLKHNVGNIFLDGDADKNISNNDTISLVYDSSRSRWLQCAPVLG